jgi:hypothetical protein
MHQICRDELRYMTESREVWGKKWPKGTNSQKELSFHEKDVVQYALNLVAFEPVGTK